MYIQLIFLTEDLKNVNTSDKKSILNGIDCWKETFIMNIEIGITMMALIEANETDEECIYICVHVHVLWILN